MTVWPDELRLAAAVSLSAFVFISCLRLAWRINRDDAIQPIVDAFLLMYLVQYLAVGLPGIVGILNFVSMSAVAIVISSAMWLVRPFAALHAPLSAPQRWTVVACTLFVASEVAAAVYGQAHLPPMANDALTYHLPAAVKWLQTGRLGLFETWFHNPANTYSPLAGSMFIAWLIAPLGNDALARFAQAPALLFVFFGMIQLCRSLGASVALASLIATGAALSRPFVSQSILAKDDLFVATFFIAAVLGIVRSSAWRAGVALGLMLAVKYTVLLSLPLLLLLIDAPFRARWRGRDWVVAMAFAVLLAGPWYVRNAWLTGNPLFPNELPLLPGLFLTRPSYELTYVLGLRNTLVTGYYSTTVWLAVPLALAWLAALGIAWKRIVRVPLVRLCLLGPPLGIAIFILASPYPEIRFVYPSLLLMFACGAIVATRARWGIIVGVMLMLAGVGTGFIPYNLTRVLPPAGIATTLLLAAWWMLSRAITNPLRRAVIAGAACLFIMGCAVYVYWEAYLRRAVSGYAALCAPAWERGGYGALAEAWEFLRIQPPRDTVAYSNTPFVYPLYGFDLRRRIVYVPTRGDVAHIHDLPRLRRKLSGEEIQPAMVKLITAEPNRDVWLRRLSDSGARYLFIARRHLAGPTSAPLPPPELIYARALPDRFVLRFENTDAVVFEIVHR